MDHSVKSSVGAWDGPGVTSREGSWCFALSEIPFLAFVLSSGISLAVAGVMHCVALSLRLIGAVPTTQVRSRFGFSKSPWWPSVQQNGGNAERRVTSPNGKGRVAVGGNAGQPAESRPTPRLRGGARWIVPSRQSPPQCSRSGAARAATKKRLCKAALHEAARLTSKSATLFVPHSGVWGARGGQRAFYG